MKNEYIVQVDDERFGAVLVGMSQIEPEKGIFETFNGGFSELFLLDMKHAQEWNPIENLHDFLMGEPLFEKERVEKFAGINE